MLATVLSMAPAAAQEKTITVLIWGTTWQTAAQKLAVAFTQKTGIKVEAATQTTSGEGLTKLQAMKARPSIDVWFTTDSVAERAVKDTDLFAAMPTASMPAWGEVPAIAKRERWVAAYAYPVGIVYRPDLLPQPPTKWEDLWGAAYKGKLGLPAPSSYQARMILIASLLAGGSIDNVDPGFEKLKALKDNVVFYYTSDAQARRALAQGEVSVLVGPVQALRQVRDQGAQVKMISPKPAPMMFDTMTLVKAGKEDLAAQYINFMIGREAQDQIANVLQAGPINQNIPAPEIIRDAMPKPGDEVTFDEDKVNRNIAAWTEKFNQTVAK
jgi:spermidine/putrescine-binding protein